MSNTSASGGFLVPAATPAPLEGISFDDFLQSVFVGLTGLDGANVRPRWQPEPPNTPDLTIDWIAFGIIDWDSDTYAAVQHDADGNETDELQRHEVVEILVSSYGPNSAQTLQQLRDGFQIAQNREVLQLNGMGLVETGHMIQAPELIKDGKFRGRIDMSVKIKRQILRSYPVLNILSVDATLTAENAQEIVIQESLNV